MKRMDGSPSQFTDTDTAADQEAARLAKQSKVPQLYSPAFTAVALIVSGIVIFASGAHIVATLVKASACTA